MICVIDAMSYALKLLTLEEHLSHAANVVAPLADTLPQALKPLGLKDHLHMPQNLHRHCYTLWQKLWHRQALQEILFTFSLVHDIRRPPPACDRLGVVCAIDSPVRQSATCSEDLRSERRLSHRACML